MKPLEKLGEARTPNGTRITLYRHDGAYLVRADGVELMSSRRHLSEDRLAEVACAPLRETPRSRVLIGGLGLGFTLRASLELLREDAEVVVAELLAEVIAWNADPAYDLSVIALADPRVRVVQADVLAVLQRNQGGFDAIMLDTDNGPDAMLMSENADLYAPRGIADTVAALRPGGSIVYWSVADDRKFAGALRHAGLTVRALHVRAHTTAGPMHTLYVATPRARGRPVTVVASTG
ncbi:MAG: spermidine synthase [Gemmatimonadales bacterium]